MPPAWVDGALLLSVGHFCSSVQQTFKQFFKYADRIQQKSFADRAFIYVTAIAPHHLQKDSMSFPNASNATNTFTPAASGTAGPPPLDRRFQC